MGLSMGKENGLKVLLVIRRCSRENTIMIKSMATESLHGLLAIHTKVTSRMTSDMAKEK